MHGRSGCLRVCLARAAALSTGCSWLHARETECRTCKEMEGPGAGAGGGGAPGETGSRAGESRWAGAQAEEVLDEV